MQGGAELAKYLPPLLRWFPGSRLLLPSARIGERDRGVYPIRMTLALLGLMSFVANSILFLLIGQAGFAGITALGGAVVLVGTLFLWRGIPGALPIGYLAVFGQMIALEIGFGPSVGAVAFTFPVAVAAYSVYRPEEWGWRLVPTLFAILFWGWAVLGVEARPLIHLARWEEQILFAYHTGGALYGVFVLASHEAMFRVAAERMIAAERDRADGLLLNILPGPIAERLKAQPGTIADSFDEVTVLFADLVGFTALSSRLSSREVVEMLNTLFIQFDELAERHGLEKIKTIGDAYMVVGGAPTPAADHALRATQMARGMLEIVRRYAENSGRTLELRIGLHTGPVTAGVIGKKKFSYDLWGDTVNVASRMESHGEPGRIQVSGAVRERLGELPLDGPRTISVKGKGEMEVWLLR